MLRRCIAEKKTIELLGKAPSAPHNPVRKTKARVKCFMIDNSLKDWNSFLNFIILVGNVKQSNLCLTFCSTSDFFCLHDLLLSDLYFRLKQVILSLSMLLVNLNSEFDAFCFTRLLNNTHLSMSVLRSAKHAQCYQSFW